MGTGLIVALASGGTIALAAAVVIVVAVLRGGLQLRSPKPPPDSELARAREEIQAQIDSGRRGLGGLLR